MWTVEWSATADQSWVERWNRASDSHDVDSNEIGSGPTRQSMLEEGQAIDRALRRDPYEVGESRSDLETRILISDLRFRVEFKLLPDTKTVRVVDFCDPADRP